ncbi:uncharacterized protein OCT59_028768 [Rhizophagus irregularis]|uniref:uncharacterized protein n=1 Tax=Rhizophagus irregularis TaxID=588596 RepID=UPI000CB960A1|nr:hypothetical protein OCT59_028768 [Rhizophagus irregularis]GBC52600.1 hypothetical protein GLOIN_2v1876583 [Rhizophagus irregularis DAOM 181602=DAOM 197198]
MWTDDEVRMLIDERKEGNAHYHSLGGGNCKRAWWISTAGKINQRFKTVYTGRQASEKFHGIVKDCRSMELSIIKDPRGKITRNGERYYLEFRNKFWKKPRLQFQRSQTQLQRQRSQTQQQQQQRDQNRQYRDRDRDQNQNQDQDQKKLLSQQQQQQDQDQNQEDQDQKLQRQQQQQQQDQQRQQQQQQQDQEQEVVQIFEEEEGGSQSSLASLAIWEIDDD